MRVLILAVVLALATSSGRATELLLAETAVREVTNDLFTAHLEARIEADDAATAQAELNAVVAEAFAALDDIDGLVVETRGYVVRPERPSEDAPERWVARQGVALEGTARGPLLDAVGDLQQLGLAALSLGARLSEEEAQAIRDELVREAIQRMRARAALAAAALDRQLVDWRQVRLDGVRPIPRPMQAEAAMRTADTQAPPTLSVGTTTVEVSVEGTATLAPAVQPE